MSDEDKVYAALTRDNDPAAWAAFKRILAACDRYRDDFRQRELDLGEMYETNRQANEEITQLRGECDEHLQRRRTLADKLRDTKARLAEALELLQWPKGPSGCQQHAAYGVDHTSGCPVCDFLALQEQQP